MSYRDADEYDGPPRKRRREDEDEAEAGLECLNTCHKYICIYDADVDRQVWVQWNMNRHSPRVYHYDARKKMLWWMDWDVAYCETSSRIPVETPRKGCTVVANVRCK